MADISQWTDGSTTYDLKDATGRSLIASETATRKSQVTALSNALEKGVGRQIRVLNSAAQGILYNEEVDSDECYTKDVPDGVLSLAAVNTVGGKSLVWNQLVSSSASSVTVTSGHIYISKIGGTWSRATSSGAALSVTGGTDCVFDITAMFGSGNEPSTVAEFRAMFPSDYYSYSANTLLNADVVNIGSISKNRLKTSTMASSGIATNNGDGTITFDGTIAANTWYFPNWFADGNLDRLEPGTYTASLHATSTTGVLMNFATSAVNSGTAGKYTSHTVNADHTTVTMTEPFYGAIAIRLTAGTYDNVTVYPMIEKGSAVTGYVPYKTYSLAIPSAARALCPNYGASAGSVYNYIDWDNRVYHQLVGSRSYQSGDESDTSVKTDGTNTYYALSEEVTVDLSSVLTADNFVQVSEGGILTLENSHGDTYRIPVPSTETFEIDVNEAL